MTCVDNKMWSNGVMLWRHIFITRGDLLTTNLPVPSCESSNNICGYFYSAPGCDLSLSCQGVTALSLWLLTYIGSWFNMLTLLILAWVVFFSAPKLYANNQAQVDEVMGQVMSQVEEVKGKVLALIPNKSVKKEE